MNACLTFLALLATFLWSATAGAKIYVTGIAYAPKSDQVLYTEEYTRDSAHQTRVQYRNTEGELVAEKQLDFSRDKHAPDVTKTDFRLHSELEISTRGDVTEVQARRDGKQAFTASIETQQPLVIDAGFDPFVQDNWDNLLANEVVKFGFLVPARKTAVKLKIRRFECATAQNRVCFRIKAANWLIAALMAPIDLEYHSSSARLMRFTGVGQLQNSSGKGQQVDIHYRYPEDGAAK